MQPISLTALRSELFKIVDQVIQTGKPVVIERKGFRVKLVLERKKSKLKNLKPHDCIAGDPDDLVAIKVG
jgi:PHD/YefM family antitoxin component YafN of YafNO toxin-antitoxin module